METLTMNIKREFFAAIVAKKKTIEIPADVVVLEETHRASHSALQVAVAERNDRTHPGGRCHRDGSHPRPRRVPATPRRGPGCEEMG